MKNLTTLIVAALAASCTTPGSTDGRNPVHVGLNYLDVKPDADGGDNLSGVGVDVRVALNKAKPEEGSKPQVSLEFGLAGASRTDTLYTVYGSSLDADVDLSEFRFGVDAQWLTGVVRPYVGGGFSSVSAELSAPGYYSTTDDAVGMYVGAGARVFFMSDSAQSPFAQIGVRQTFGHEGDYGSLDYTAFVLGAGFSF